MSEFSFLSEGQEILSCCISRCPIYKGSLPEVFCKKGFQNSQETPLSESFFSVNLQVPPSCKFCEIFKNSIFYKTPPVAASWFISIRRLPLIHDLMHQQWETILFHVQWKEISDFFKVMYKYFDIKFTWNFVHFYLMTFFLASCFIVVWVKEFGHQGQPFSSKMIHMRLAAQHVTQQFQKKIFCSKPWIVEFLVSIWCDFKKLSTRSSHLVQKLAIIRGNPIR